MYIVRKGQFFLTGPSKHRHGQELSVHVGHDGAPLDVSYYNIKILEIVCY